MNYIVIDTNVPVVANGHSEQASRACVQTCQMILAEINADKRIVVIDNAWKIIGEYQRHLNPSGRQPGVGDKFLRWLLTNSANPKRCQQVRITPSTDWRSFAEFPNDPALKDFDHSDRKFVAVACAHSARPPVANAVDTDWLHYQHVLATHGVTVVQLCPCVLEEMSTGRG